MDLEDLAHVREAQIAAARAAHRTYIHKQTHEPSVIDYIAAEIGRALPVPAWYQRTEHGVHDADSDTMSLSPSEPDDVFYEGARTEVVRTHLRRERSLREKKIAAVLLSGASLACEACGFDFATFYGPMGDRYIQVHHLLPLGDRSGPSETTLNDLALLCANCHVMAHHRARETPRSVADLREALGASGARRGG
jgi:predicted HNH restriction endonuclease